MDIADLRKSYERDALDEQASEADPLQQFETWLQQAIDGQLPEPNAMTLATVGADGRPSTRVVLIKGFDARGIVWYTNYDSRKGRELAGSPGRAAVPLGGARAGGAHRGPGREGQRRRVRRLLRRRGRSIRASAPGPRRRAR
jgi:hypothetical protein